jgi:hypothetical protein
MVAVMGKRSGRRSPRGGAGWVTILLWLGLLLGGHAQTARAAEPSISAVVEPSVIGIEDQATLTVRISAGASGVLSRPSLPELERFVVTSTGSSRNMTIVNGRMESLIAYSYTLRPKQKGKFTIPPISVSMRGKEYKTAPLALEVKDGSLVQRRGGHRSRRSLGDPLDPMNRWDRNRRGARRRQEIDPRDHVEIETSVDQSSAVTGQQITLLFRLATSPQIRFERQPNYTPPEVLGGWVEELGEEKRYDEVRAGVRWEIVELRYALFPTAPGEMQIGPAKLDASVSSGRVDIFSLMNGRGRRLLLETDPIEVQVSTLPEKGQPDDFAGAVGSFAIRARFDRDRGTVNDPLTLTIEIEGRGNLRTLPDPPMPEVEGLRFFEPQVKVETGEHDGHFGGRRTLTRLVVPEQAGTLLFPALDLPYFDPDAGRYRHARTSAIRLQILPGEGGDSGPVVSGLSKEEVKRLKSDIEYICTDPPPLLPAAPAPYHRFGFWLLVLLPLPAIAGALFWRRRHDRLEQDVGYARASRAFRSLRQGLARLRRLPAGDREIWSLSNRILLNYLGDRFNLNTAGLTTLETIELVARAEIPEETAGAIRDFLSSCDLARYAPGGAQMSPDQIADHIEEIATAIEKPSGAALLISRAAAAASVATPSMQPRNQSGEPGGKKL